MNEQTLNGRTAAIETSGSEQILTILNKRGLHARASAKFVSTAGKFDARVPVSKDGVDVCATSIMGLMMLAAAPGDQITIRAAGRDAPAVISALTALVAEKFGEE